MIYNEMYLEFTLDYDGQCETIDTFEVDGQDFSDDVYYDDVNKFVKELEKLENFYVSEHRTEVRVFWENEKMNVLFRYGTNKFPPIPLTLDESQGFFLSKEFLSRLQLEIVWQIVSHHGLNFITKL